VWILIPWAGIAGGILQKSAGFCRTVATVPADGNASESRAM
jgi:hypothetical protein